MRWNFLLFSFQTKHWSSLTFVFPSLLLLLFIFQNRNNISNNFLPSLFSQLLSIVKCVHTVKISVVRGMRKMWRFEIQQPCHSSHKLSPRALFSSYCKKPKIFLFFGCVLISCESKRESERAFYNYIEKGTWKTIAIDENSWCGMCACHCCAFFLPLT